MQKPAHKQSIITLAAFWLKARTLLSARAVFLQERPLESELKQG